MAMDGNGTKTKQLDLMMLHMISVVFFEDNSVRFSFGLREYNVMDPVALSYLKHHASVGHFANSCCKAFCLKKEPANEVRFVPKHVCMSLFFEGALRHQFVWPVEGCLL